MDVNNKSFFDIVIGFSYHFISQQKCWAFLLWKISTEVSLEHVSNDDQALETKVTKAAVSPKRQSSWDGHGKPPILGLLLDVGESQLGGFCCWFCGRPEDLGGLCRDLQCLEGSSMEQEPEVSNPVGSFSRRSLAQLAQDHSTMFVPLLVQIRLGNSHSYGKITIFNR